MRDHVAITFVVVNKQNGTVPITLLLCDLGMTHHASRIDRCVVMATKVLDVTEANLSVKN